jgi:type II secretory pathway component PulC
MSDSLRKKIVFATLPLAILWAVFNYPSRKTNSQPALVEPTASTETPVIASSEPTPANSRPTINVEAKRLEPWGDDPFRPVDQYTRPRVGNHSESTSLAWALAGIIYSDKSPIALVNSHMVGVGDKIDSATVVSIDRESITLEYQGRTITLKLHKG